MQFNSVEGFWCLYNDIVVASKLHPKAINYCIRASLFSPVPNRRRRRPKLIGRKAYYPPGRMRRTCREVHGRCSCLVKLMKALLT
jgi:hypothetical protein